MIDRLRVGFRSAVCSWTKCAPPPASGHCAKSKKPKHSLNTSRQQLDLHSWGIAEPAHRQFQLPSEPMPQAREFGAARFQLCVFWLKRHAADGAMAGHLSANPRMHETSVDHCRCRSAHSLWKEIEALPGPMTIDRDQGGNCATGQISFFWKGPRHDRTTNDY